MSHKYKPRKLSEELVQALHSKNYELLHELVTPSTINLVDSKGRALLTYAINHSDLLMVEWVLSKQPNLDMQDNAGWTALHFAAQRHDAEMVIKLLEAGAKVDTQDAYGNTPLGRAAFESHGRGDVIKALLSHGADANKKNNSDMSPSDLAHTIANYNVRQYFNA